MVEPLPLVGRQGSYLAKLCTEQVAKDQMPKTYPPELRTPDTVFARSVKLQGIGFEDEIKTRLQQEVGDMLCYITEQTSEDGQRTWAGREAKEEETFAAYLNPKYSGVFNARIGPVFEELLSKHLGHKVQDPYRISEPDLILFGDEMDNGLRSMTFVDIKSHKVTSGKSVRPHELAISTLKNPWPDASYQQDFYGTIRTDDWVQLAHYFSHGVEIGVTDPTVTIHGVLSSDEFIVWGDLKMVMRRKVDGAMRKTTPLGIYARDFERGVKVVDNARERDTDKSVVALTRPEKKTACGMCHWRDVCFGELENFGTGGHITLLPAVTVTNAADLYAAGVEDIHSLAALDVSDHVYSQWMPRAIWNARAWLANQPVLIEATPQDEPFTVPRAGIEVDFDCESSETVYMWGVRVTNRDTGVVTKRTFDTYCGTANGERDVFIDVWRYFQQLMEVAAEVGQTIMFYHYTPYERTQMRKLADTYVDDPRVPLVSDVLDFYRSDVVCDMYPLLANNIVWPTADHSLKTLAMFAGFAWRDETPGGDLSMVWYEDACNNADPLVREANVVRLRQYNEDDVHAQVHLRNWFDQQQWGDVHSLPIPTSVMAGAV